MFQRGTSLGVLLAFCLSLIAPYQTVWAKDAGLILPKPGAMVNLSPAFEPVMMKGLKVDPKNPFRFEFILDPGDVGVGSKTIPTDLKIESTKLIKYFLASLTIPEKDLWVNLSPYEKDRMIPSTLAQTEMGRDMLSQDYILKQLTASLIYPEKELGKAFWDKVYSKAQAIYGSTQIPVNTFNKVWIVADKADVFERGNVAYVVGAHLKVMLEEDYLANSKNQLPARGHVPDKTNRNVSPSTLPSHVGLEMKATQGQSPNVLGNQIIREIVLPALEQEINTGKHFALLRQMFYSMILASWYKMALKDALISKIYGNQSKVKVGINQKDIKTNDEIFNQYLKAYKKGVFNYIKEDISAIGGTASGGDHTRQQRIPRKYFSGGEHVWQYLDHARVVHMIPRGTSFANQAMIAVVDMTPKSKNSAMASKLTPNQIINLFNQKFPDKHKQIAGLPIADVQSIINPTTQRAFYRDFKNRTERDGIVFSRSATNPVFLNNYINHIMKFVKPGQKILCVGEGRGHVAAELKKRGIDVYAIDLSEENTVISKRKGVNQMVGDARDLLKLYGPENFDIVLFSESIGAMPMEDVLKQAHLVLKQGGNLLIGAYPSTEERVKISHRSKFVYYSTLEINEALTKAKFSHFHHEPVYENPVNFFDLDEMPATYLNLFVATKPQTMDLQSRQDRAMGVLQEDISREFLLLQRKVQELLQYILIDENWATSQPVTSEIFEGLDLDANSLLNDLRTNGYLNAANVMTTKLQDLEFSSLMQFTNPVFSAKKYEIHQRIKKLRPLMDFRDITHHALTGLLYFMLILSTEDLQILEKFKTDELDDIAHLLSGLGASLGNLNQYEIPGELSTKDFMFATQLGRVVGGVQRALKDRVFLEEHQQAIAEVVQRIELISEQTNQIIKQIRDQAMSNTPVDSTKRTTPGGIDFDRSKMQMNVSKEGQGVQMDAPARGRSAFGGDQAMIERIQREGFDGLEFTIRSLEPVKDLELFLGLKEKPLSLAVAK